jgi:hypothetical protein
MPRPNGGLDSGELVFTTRENSDALQRSIERGEARRIARGVVTTNVRSPLEEVVHRNWARIAAHYAPGATVVDRTFFDGGPAGDGTVVLDVGPDGTRRTKPIELPGLRIVTRRGPGPVTGDVPFMDGLRFSGQVRAYLDNLRPARARGGARRTLTNRHCWPSPPGGEFRGPLTTLRSSPSTRRISRTTSKAPDSRSTRRATSSSAESSPLLAPMTPTTSRARTSLSARALPTLCHRARATSS